MSSSLKLDNPQVLAAGSAALGGGAGIGAGGGRGEGTGAGAGSGDPGAELPSVGDVALLDAVVCSLLPPPPPPPQATSAALMHNAESATVAKRCVSRMLKSNPLKSMQDPCRMT